jgi:tellurite resistance protein TerC
MIYVFGGFLIFTGIKLLFAGEEKIDPEKNPAVRLVRRFMNVTPDYHGQQFFIRKDGRLWATPLLLVLWLWRQPRLFSLSIQSRPSSLSL